MEVVTKRPVDAVMAAAQHDGEGHDREHAFERQRGRAEVERDGRTISRVQKISFEGGSTRELNFDFQAASVAAR